jgi:hypothetical protein
MSSKKSETLKGLSSSSNERTISSSFLGKDKERFLRQQSAFQSSVAESALERSNGSQRSKQHDHIDFPVQIII